MVAFLFPGQGSQQVGMGQELFSRPEGREVLAEAAQLGWTKPVPDLTEKELSCTAIAQPAIFLVEWAAFLVAKRKRAPDAVAGHSLGEFSALAAAGVLNWSHAFQIVLLRGKLMEEAAQKHPGGMLAVLGLPLATVEAGAKETGCFVANVNAPDQVVLAGELSSLEEAEKFVQKQGGKAIRLAVAGAFHSPFMTSAAEILAEALGKTPFCAPKVTFVSSSSGEVERDPARIRAILRGQMTGPVRWVRAVETLAAQGVEEAWEIGPGQVLTRLGRRISPRIRFRALAEVLRDV